MKKLTQKAKGAIIGSVAGLAAVAVGVGIWQPWKQSAPVETPDPPKQTEIKPQPPEEEPLTLNVGGDKIPCTLYEGECPDGKWSVYVPEGWTVLEEGEDYLRMGAEDADWPEAEITVSVPTEGSYPGDFTSLACWEDERLSPEGETARSFYTAGYEPHGWEILCVAETGRWSDYDRLMTAVARTFTACWGERPFEEARLAREPSWQETDGKTVLWMDKDGYVLDDVMEMAAEAEQGEGRQDGYTGAYRLAPIRWAGSYVGLTEGFVDVFETVPWYEMVPGQEPELAGGSAEKDGWAANMAFMLNLAVYHDGSTVTSAVPFWLQDISAGDPQFALWLVRERDKKRDLNAAELQSVADWFNEREHNGLLRFPYRSGEEVGPYLQDLFYDLGDGEGELSGQEKAALEARDCPMWMDILRLSRSYVMDYLQKKLGLSEKAAEGMLETYGDQLGTYLEEYDAWYSFGTDTEWQSYSFDNGAVYQDGRVELRHTIDALWLRGDFWEQDWDILHGVPMEVTLRPDAFLPEKWTVESNMIMEE